MVEHYMRNVSLLGQAAKPAALSLDFSSSGTECHDVY